MNLIYLTVILRGRTGYELIYITNEAVGRVGYYQLISGKSEKNNCFSKFSSNSLDFFGWTLRKSWHFLYRRRRETIFSDLQNFSTRNSPSVFPYLVKLNDNGSYDGLREPIRKLEKSLSWAKNLLKCVICCITVGWKNWKHKMPKRTITWLPLYLWLGCVWTLVQKCWLVANNYMEGVGKVLCGLYMRVF